MPMTPISFFARLAAATAAVSLCLQPLAMAERGHGGGHHDRRDRGYDHDDRDDHYRRRGDDDRGYYRDHDRGYRSDYRGHHRDRDYRHYDAPRYYSNHGYGDRYSGATVTYSYSTRPAYGYRSGYDTYRPRYNVGGNYNCHDRTVYVSDYDRYGLYDPPRGYRWVHDQDDGDAILASVATGAIIGLVVGAIAAGD
jgi:Ni/Co efflux regulator RcnB